MRRNEARIALEAAQEWEGKGMFKPGAYAHIEKSLQENAEQPSLAMQSFYAIGGVLLGAATAALFALLRLNDWVSQAEATGWTFFAACAVVLLVAGVAVHLSHQRELGDALLLAGIVPLAILLGPEPPVHDVLWAVPGLGALGILAFRRDAYLLPVVSLGLTCVAWPVWLFRYFPSYGSDTAAWAWLAIAAVIWGAMAAWNRFVDPAWDDEGAAITTVALAASWVGIVTTVIEPDFDGGYEILIGLGLAALIGAGVLLKQRGIVFAAGIGLTVDAIVFAFAFGGPTIGLLTLLLLAGGLITAATLLRRRKAQTDDVP